VDRFRKIYDSSGRALRVLLVNAYGLKNNARYRRWEKLLDSIEYTERLDREAQIRLAREKLAGIIGFAIRKVPFYEKFSSLGKDLDASNVFEILVELPVVGKEEIRKEPEAFLARDHGDYVTSGTSGTTGTPFHVHMDGDTFLLGDALWWRRTIWAGLEKSDWIARLVGDPVIPLRVKDPEKPWIVSHLDRRIYLSTFHLNRGAALRIGMLLNRRRPAYIMGYPSSLEILSGYLDESGFEIEWKPKKILFSSEPMYTHQEEIIKRVFKAEISGLYGSAEKVISAAQCENGTYHLSLVDGYLEGQFGILDNRQPGLVTTLTNRIMPLIRYEIGDVIEANASFSCPCGRTLPAIDPVITKLEDWVITPSGRKISPSAITWAFKHEDMEKIIKSQVVQEEIGVVKVYIDTDESSLSKFRDELVESLNKMFFGEMKIDIIRTDEFEIMQSGKSRFVVNKLREGYRDATADPES
jgi:phenylacetate-CoA ligase